MRCPHEGATAENFSQFEEHRHVIGESPPVLESGAGVQLTVHSISVARAADPDLDLGLDLGLGLDLDLDLDLHLHLDLDLVSALNNIDKDCGLCTKVTPLVQESAGKL